MHLKHGWIRFGCIKQLHLLVVLGWVGLGQSADVLGWIGSHKMGPRTTLVRYTSICRRIRSPGAVLRSWMATKSVPCSSLGRQLPTSLANARVSFADSAKEQFSYRLTVTWRCVISQAPAAADFLCSSVAALHPVFHSSFYPHYSRSGRYFLRTSAWKRCNSEQKCADTIDTVPVPWAVHFQRSLIKIILSFTVIFGTLSFPI